jgi:hypothetical protein
MTADEARQELVRMHESLAYFTEAECRRVNHLIDIINEARMATGHKVKVGKVSKKALAEGKIKPSKSAPPHFTKAKAKKADRQEAGLRRNREAKRA